MSKTLIVFARKPVLGKVKTRLSKDTGDKKALEIYVRLLENTLKSTNEVQAITKVYWSERLDSNDLYIQNGTDLGERMYNALVKEGNAFKKCLIGTDTPLLTSIIIENAFKALDTHDIVFGPSKDGGYYLVATKALLPKEIFIDRTWSHGNVLSEALAVCKSHHLSVKLMPTLLDIDTIKDYNQWKNIKE